MDALDPSAIGWITVKGYGWVSQHAPVSVPGTMGNVAYLDLCINKQEGQACKAFAHCDLSDSVLCCEVNLVIGVSSFYRMRILHAVGLVRDTAHETLFLAPPLLSALTILWNTCGFFGF